MITDDAAMTSPSSNVTRCNPASDNNDIAFEASFILTPNFCACKMARAASSSPERPAGNPR